MPDERMLERIHERIDETHAKIDALVEMMGDLRSSFASQVTFCRERTTVLDRHATLLNGDGTTGSPGMRVELDRVEGYQRWHRWWILSLAGVLLTIVGTVGGSWAVQWIADESPPAEQSSDG